MDRNAPTQPPRHAGPQPHMLQYAPAYNSLPTDAIFKASIQFGLICGLSSTILEIVAHFYVEKTSDGTSFLIPPWVLFFGGQCLTIWYASAMMLIGLWIGCLIRKQVHVARFSRIMYWALPFPAINMYYQSLPPEMQENPGLTAFSWTWTIVYPFVASWWIGRKQFLNRRAHEMP